MFVDTATVSEAVTKALGLRSSLAVLILSKYSCGLWSPRRKAGLLAELNNICK